MMRKTDQELLDMVGDTVGYSPETLDAVAKELRKRNINLKSQNLLRWEQSGFPRKWMDDHRGQWNHTDWLNLLESLKRTEFWPMEPDAIGGVLENLKRNVATASVGKRRQAQAELTSLIENLWSRDVAESEGKSQHERNLLRHDLRSAFFIGSQVIADMYGLSASELDECLNSLDFYVSVKLHDLIRG